MFLYALVSEDETKIDNDNFYIDNQITLCPLCNYIDDSYEDLQIEDYVTQPMLWCDNCGCRLVLDLKHNYDDNYDYNYNTENLLFNVSEEVKDIFENIIIEDNIQNPLIFGIPLVKIHKVVNRDLYKYGVKESQSLSQKELIKFINSDFDLENNPKFYKKPKKKEDYYKPTSDSEDLGIFIDTPDRIIDFDVGLIIDDYNVDKVNEICPKLDLSHDGRCVYLQCYSNEGENGELYQMTYWGD